MSQSCLQCSDQDARLPFLMCDQTAIGPMRSRRAHRPAVRGGATTRIICYIILLFLGGFARA
eukprot:12899048-Heterocapsa_arctica.AAC.1